MSNDRIDAMVELAEAMHMLWRFKCEHQDGIASGDCPPHLLKRSEDALKSAAERLDKAMSAWWMGKFYSVDVVTSGTTSSIGNFSIASGAVVGMPRTAGDAEGGRPLGSTP